MRLTSAFRRGILHGLSGAVVCGAASASTIIVDPGGSGDYLTIQEGIDHAVAGDTILVAAGTYVENLIIPVSVTIIGAGTGQSVILPATSIPGSGGGSQVTTTTWLARIQADDVIINGFTFDGDNPSFPKPIDARGGIITDFTAGTFSGAEVIGCEVKNIVFRGIYVAAFGTGHRVISNTVSNVKGLSLDSAGIFFYGAIGESAGNVVDDCSIGMGFYVGGGGEFAGNTISNCDIGIFTSQSDSPVTLTGNTVSACTQGFQAIFVDTTVDIDDNEILGCLTGVALIGLGTGSVSVDGNTIDGEFGFGSTGIFATTDGSSYGVGDLTFTATNNVVFLNQFGVVLKENISDSSPILSCVLSGDAATYNTFTECFSYNLYLEVCDDDVDATHNVWGAVSPPLVEPTIYHQVDDPVLGLVDFSNATALYVTVDDDGPTDYPTINAAVQALLPGGTIRVMPGLYVEDVLIDRSCLIQGLGTSDDPAVGTILQGASNSVDMSVVEVTGPDVFIDNLRVDGQQPIYNHARRGIYGNGTSGLTVTGCVVHTARTAIAYTSSTDGFFLENEVYDFGESLNAGGGIFLWNSTGKVGLLDQGNYVHDGLATGIIFHNSSAGVARDNVVENAALGYLSNGAIALTVFRDNIAIDCEQGYQSIANHVPVNYVGNDSGGGSWGYVLFGLGAQLHTYLRNRAHHTGEAWSITTECIYGDDNAVAAFKGNIATQCQYGVVLEETATSKSFLMDVNLNGANSPNWIQGNDVQDILLIECDDDIDARENYLGSTDPAAIETQITHQVDDPLLGLVDFSLLEPAFIYCTAKLASAECLPSIDSSGICSVTSPQPFNVIAADVVSEQFGFLFYAWARNEIPFWGGTMCLQGPLRRTQVQHSGGTGPDNCTGTFSFDMNALIQTGNYPNTDPGTSLYAQYWFRDPALGGTYPAGLTNAITFTIAP